ncbi:MAG: exonuclease SbcCD subunit D [Clostridiales bacterium]|nr:exonuclease SbcCD subunit D [Clostridiales bacterium]
MKFIHTADLHLGRTLGDLSLLEDQKHALKQIADHVRDYAADALLISGDVYQKASPQAEAMEVFDAFLNDVRLSGCKVFVISGNHDSGQRIDYFGRLIEKSGVFPAGKPEKTLKRVELKDDLGIVNVYLMPFVRPHHVRALHPDKDIKSYTDAVETLIQATEIDYSQRNIILLHQYITGGELSGSEDLSLGTLDNVDAEVFGKFDYAALGHVHGAQKISSEHIRYAGSPLKYSFSECDQKKSVALVELKEKGHVTVTKLPIVPLREVRHINTTMEHLAGAERSDDYIWLTISDEMPPKDWYRQAQEIFPNMVRHDVVNTKTSMLRDLPEANEFRAALDPQELFTEFYVSQNNGKQPTGEQVELFKRIYKEAQSNETA